jgi:hypothetical protein
MRFQRFTLTSKISIKTLTSPPVNESSENDARADKRMRDAEGADVHQILQPQSNKDNVTEDCRLRYKL